MRFFLLAVLLPSFMPAASTPDMPVDYRADAMTAIAAGSRATTQRFPDADRVMVDDRIHVAYEPDGSQISWDDEWVKVLTEKGRRAASTVTLDYNARYGDVSIFAVEIVGTDGVVRAVDFGKTLKTATDNSSMGSNIVDPMARKLSCAVSGLAVGEIRHVRFARRTLKARMRDTWADAQMFEYTMPILSTVYTVDQPAECPIRHARIRHPFGKTVVRAPDRPLGRGRTLLRWDVRDVPQAFPEPNMPPLSTCVQSIRLSTIPDWQTVSRWYWDLCVPHLETSTPEMTDLVRKLVKDERAKGRGERGDERERIIRAVFKFVSQRIRYMGLTMESGSPGYEPHDVKVTFENRYGVCRDKAALLVQLLRLAGIPAYPVLIHAGAKIDPEVPTPWFNHAIVAVDGGTDGGKYLLMDPTDETTRDLLPAYLSDRSYLVARPEGETLRVSPVRSVKENMMTVASDGTLASDGTILLRSSFAFDGINDTAFRHTLIRRTPEERRRLFENLFRNLAPGGELLSFELLPADLDDTGKRLSVKTVARLPNRVLRGRTRDELALPFVSRVISVANSALDENFALEKRRFPLKISSTAGTAETLTLVLGDGVGKLLALPPATTVGKGDGYTFALATSVTNGVLHASRTMRVEDVNFDVSVYDRVRNDRKETESAERIEPQFAARADDDANIRWISDETVVHLTSPTSWVSTNTVVKEVLTYKGKKSASELRFTYAPSTHRIEILSASVSNRNGQVHHVTATEINEMDVGWAASAPRYPASRILVVNLPGVEVGSVIRLTVARTVADAPIAYSGVFTFGGRDPVDQVSVELHVPASCRFAYRESRIQKSPPLARDRRTGVVYGSHVTADGMTCHRWSVRRPPRVPNEPSQPPLTMWRPHVGVSAADWPEFGAGLLEALSAARDRGRDAACRTAEALTKDCATACGKIQAIRRYLAHNLRVSGPGIFGLPFAQAFFAPDRALADGYASSADRLNLFYTMLDAIGLDPSFVLVTGDGGGFRATEEKRRAVPRPALYDTLLVRVAADGRFYWIGGENEYTPPETSSCAGNTFYDPEKDMFGRVSLLPAPTTSSWWAPWTWFASAAPTNAPMWGARAESSCRMTVRENGAVDFDLTNRTWGAGVGGFRKRYAEMVPEMRNRHFQELVGALAQNATATGDLETDVTGYPAALSFSAYVPEYAVAENGMLTVRIPDFTSEPFSLGGDVRRSPIHLSATTESADVYEVVFPKGYTVIEHLPEAFTLRSPIDPKAEWIVYTVSSQVVDGCLHVTLRRTARRKAATKLTDDYAPFLREWNRRASSQAGRTLSVRKR